jgi:hypothetical protein
MMLVVMCNRAFRLVCAVYWHARSVLHSFIGAVPSNNEAAVAVWNVQVDSEMNILRGERDQAKDIIDDLQKKLQVVVAVLNDYDLERQVCSTACVGIEPCIVCGRVVALNLFLWF